MNDNVKELKSALTMLSYLNVSGDAVDMMAAAKQKIRNVIADLEQQDEGEKKNI